MENAFLKNINNYFSFLSSEYGFKGPYEFLWVHEYHVNYVKGRLVVDINFDHPFYFVKLFDTKNTVPELENGEVRFKDLWPQTWPSYELNNLCGDKGKTLSKLKETPLKQLEYYQEILKKYPELLNADFRQFSSWRIFLRKYFRWFVAA